MWESDLPRVQTKRRVFHFERLRFTELVVLEVHRVADDGVAEVPEVDADLIGAPGVRSDAQECRTIGETRAHCEFSVGADAGFFVDDS